MAENVPPEAAAGGLAIASGPSDSPPPTLVGLYRQIEQERRLVKRLRLVASLALVAILASFGFFIYRLFADFSGQAFVYALQDRLLQMQPEFAAAAQEVTNNVSDEVWGKLQGTMRERLPLLRRAAEAETGTFKDNLHERLRARLDLEASRQLTKRRTLILKYFPDLRSSENQAQLLARMQRVSRRAAEKVLADDFAQIQRQVEVIEALLARADVRARIESLKQDPKVRAKFVGYLLANIARPLYEGVGEDAMGAIQAPKSAEESGTQP